MSNHFLCLFLIFLTILQCYGQQNLGILFADGGENSHEFCVSFNPKWGPIWKTDLKKATKLPLAWADPPLLCNGVFTKDKYLDKAVAAVRGNCSFYEKGMKVQDAGGKSVIIINTEDHLVMPSGNESAGDYENLAIPVMVMTKGDGKTLKDLGKHIVVQMYQPEEKLLDGNIFVLWILAVGTVVVGAYWTGIANSNIVSRHILRQHGTEQDGNQEEEQSSLVVTPVMIVIFVVLICGLLLLLFFFYSVLVYVVIVLFVFASCNGLFECLTPVVLWLPLGSCKVPPNRLPVFKNEPQIRIILLAIFCVAFAVWWGIERNASYAWILQDILGIAFCISLLKNIRLPNLKVCMILLILLLIYDIFFVFITPLFSASGKSVMVEVATGGNHKEQLPMVLKIPKIAKSPSSVCLRPYSLLGFGDILVPGLFIGFCHSFDIMQNTPKKIYFVATSIAYGVGLILTFIALFIMKKGQPALLYLVPCILITGIVIALVRKEFRKLWTGKMVLTSEHVHLAMRNLNETQPPSSV
ncbi:signal peptide peptidase-like 2B isoform X2 [Exaiptasia diaphana]|uniref:PA domain-containing protein n=1 Tax=Exaiptasia diaphana TaxID=2652724 RepID=A0A913X577_EXADI|nr:signal peptide peptidase-like 2B isoform X2 [Exaiptasia diaphana]